MKSLRIEKLKSLSLAALLIASATFTACSSDDSINENLQPGQNPTGEYSLTIKASKGSKALTRALSLSGSTLNATWKTGEKVKVYKVTGDIGSETYNSVGTLTAQVSGEAGEADEAILSGTLSGSIEAGDDLALFFNSNNGVLDYTGQTGTLEGIASKYDYATAFATVAEVDDGGTITIENGGDYKDVVPFDNQQAIVKFTLMNGDNNLSASKLTLCDDNNNIFQRYNVIGDGSDDVKGDLTVTRSTAGNVFYVAIKTEEDDYTLEPSSLDLTLTAETENGELYTYTKYNVAFKNGKYYEITVKMAQTFYDPEGNPIEDPVVVDWLTSNGFTQANINALGNDYSATDKFYECYINNCDFRVEGAGLISIDLTDIIYHDENGVISSGTLKLVRKAPLGAIYGNVYFYGKENENDEAEQIPDTSVSFDESYETFATAPTTGELTQTATVTFYDITAKFIEPQVHAGIVDNGEEPFEDPEEPEPDEE